MKSKLAQEARQARISDIQRLMPEERLNVFLEHCQLMMALHEAGRQVRDADGLAEPEGERPNRG